MTRRRTLALVGGGVILAAGAGAVELGVPPLQARAPWRLAGDYDDPRLRALSWAILAPNPHNQQPWLVDIGTPDTVVLYANPEKLLPHTDPFSRQIVIGLGCFLETLAIAAAEEGYAVTTELFPEGSDARALDARPVAIARFAAGAAEPDPDFAQIAHRRTQKEPYAERIVPDALLAEVLAAGRHGVRFDGTNDPERIGQLIDLSVAAFDIELRTPRTYRESVDVFRIGRAEINAQPDGIDLGGPMFQALGRLGLLTRETALDPEGIVFRSGYDAVMANVTTAGGHVWLCTQGNTRADQIAAGRDWMRFHLAATRVGLGVQPLSQALQEYSEMAPLYTDVHGRLANPGETVQMWARVGFAPDVPPSPRWPIEAKVVNA
ncbi:twin-arginine translocation pathway signal protein [Pseudaestuariivita atlantica]|uniref:Twin-arginine translocation pathway signal protein n=1 Tax=Pseudaestuariivita atlantica TaxID=1317121 RepID=A0A0L1JW68_9RHOB|nr:twin-arginine translocation pathway signal protein [Pseudaestuariivita atlantica]